jgi:phosphate:Na+ symporter
MFSLVFTALGGFGLFLLGMVIMTGGQKALAGDNLRRVLSRFTVSPFSGVFTGTSVTALIQSSRAFTVR